MWVEGTFGLLKGRWRILLHRIEMDLDHIPDVVGACILLHNLCLMQKDLLDEKMVEEPSPGWFKTRLRILETFYLRGQ